MEETLYNTKGLPVAYINYGGDSVIYLWSGFPVAYIISDMVYGFNGKHLGWYINGVMWNSNGCVNGYNKTAADVWVSVEPYKGFKEFLPFKAFREYPKMKPIFVNVKSKKLLEKMLIEGRA